MKFISTTSAVAILATVLALLSATASKGVSSDGRTITADVKDYPIYRNGHSFVTNATYRKYYAGTYDWKLTSDLACYPFYQDEAPEWGSKFGWVAYCLPFNQDDLGPNICGQCVRIQKINMDYITARVVDQCKIPGGGLQLDYETVFLQIEKTESGRASGQVRVEYHFVSCFQ